MSPVYTDARGLVGLNFQNHLTRLVFIVNVEKIGNFTDIYIYKGDKNENGTIVSDLLKSEREHKSLFKNIPYRSKWEDNSNIFCWRHT